MLNVNCDISNYDVIHEAECKLGLSRGSVWIFVKSGGQGWIRLDDYQLRDFAILDNGLYIHAITHSRGAPFVHGNDVHLMQLFIPDASLGYINKDGNFVEISSMIGCSVNKTQN